MKKAFRLLCFSALLLLNFKVDAQCTTVCGTVAIKGGTIIVTPSGTQTVTPSPGSTFTVQQKAGTTFTTSGTTTITPTGNYTIATTYSYVTVAGANSISSGALSVSISNTGDSSALFNGTEFPSGLTINLEIPNAILPSYTYDCQTSKLAITVNR